MELAAIINIITINTIITQDSTPAPVPPRKHLESSVGDPDLFSGLPDPHPDPLATSTDPDPSNNKQK
jgi:hypothetical protein